MDIWILNREHILNVPNDGLTTCCCCSCAGLACTESGWVSGYMTCCFVVLAKWVGLGWFGLVWVGFSDLLLIGQ